MEIWKFFHHPVKNLDPWFWKSHFSIKKIEINVEDFSGLLGDPVLKSFVLFYDM